MKIYSIPHGIYPKPFDMPEIYSYPDQPGFQNTDTSKAAAESVKSKAPALRKQVLEALCNHVFGATPDTIANELNESILSIRPRITELKLKGLIEDSGRRGKTDMGKASIIWIAK